MTVNQRNLSATEHSGLCDRATHLTAGMVCDEPYGIDGFPCGTGSYKDLLSCEVFGKCDLFQNVLEENRLLWHSAVTGITVGQHTPVRCDDFVAKSLQLCEVVLYDGVVVHIVIHGRGDDLFTGASHHRGGQHIIRNAVGDFSDHIGRSGGDHDHISPLGEGDMFHAVLEVPVKGVDQTLVAGERFEGNGIDELGGILGHQYLDITVELFQHPRQIGDLVCRDTSANGQNNGFSC